MQRVRRHAAPTRRAFSLVELVLVTIIIGLIASIAVPRVSYAMRSAGASALEATIVNVRQAMELYGAEHGRYPGYSTTNETPSHEDFVKQLTLYSDETGRTSESLGYPYIYGPYLRAPFPTNPVNGLNTVAVKKTTATITPQGSTGWVAVLATGDFYPNVPDSVLEAFGVADVQRLK